MFRGYNFIVYTAIITVTFLSICAHSIGAQTDDLRREVEAKKTELEKIRAELEKNRRDVERLKGKERKIGSQVHSLEKEIGLIQKYIRALRSEERRLKEQIRLTDTSLKQAQKGLSKHQKDFAKRLRAIYKKGRLNQIEVLISSKSFPDLLRRYKYLSLIARQDRRDYQRIEREKEGIEEAKRTLEADYKAKLRLDQEKVKERGNLKARKAQRQELLASILSDRRLMEERIADQKQAMAEIESTIERYMEEIKRRGEKALPYDFSARKGKLLWPLEGPVLAHFGRHRDRELKTVTFNRGIDISAPEGSEVRVIAPGIVVLADWLRGYGKFLMVHHNGGYFTIYGHLSEIFVQRGNEIAEGEVLAISGDTGSLDGPKLHFEILRGKEPQNPLEWLAKR